MEDVLDIEYDLPGGMTYAAVFDGHGGELSSGWLKNNLFKAVSAAAVGGSPLLDDDADATPDGPPPSDGGGGGDGDGGGWRRGALGRDLLPGVLWPRRAAAVLGDVFQEVDAELIAYLRAEFGIEEMGASGSTALVALINADKAIFASLGDCLAVVGRGGAAGKVTQQHRVYGYGADVLEEVERIEAAGGWVMDGRVCNVLAVSRAFGDPEFKGEGLKMLMREGARKGMWPATFADTHVFKSDPVIVTPDVTEVRFTPEDDFLIMATDGLWDAVPVAEAAALARKQFSAGKSAQEVAAALTDHALKRFTTDNASVVVADLRSDARRRAGGGGGGGWLGGLFSGR
ncbi:MAG: phosphatase 2C-like domain-containing protein [Monoraphidium minutum]|nr:MAG: phosphatase 2C-like domain-containing protein [Monoraphidium minutum]